MTPASPQKMYAFSEKTLELLENENHAIKIEVLHLLKTFNATITEPPSTNGEFLDAFTACSQEARTFFAHSLLVEVLPPVL